MLQSGFRPLQSIETALLRVLSDILAAVDRGVFASLVLLDLFAAFDMVDHDILLQRLQTSFGIGGTALKWFQSYLTSRTHLCPSWYGPIDHCSADTWCSTGLSAWSDVVYHVYS